MRQRGQRETWGWSGVCIRGVGWRGGGVDQTGVVEVLEQSHNVEEDERGGSTKRLPYSKTFPQYISGMSFEC